MSGIEQWGTSLILWLRGHGSPLSDTFPRMVTLHLSFSGRLC